MRKDMSESVVKQREVWIDHIKMFACMLVMLGHFFRSMVAAQIVPDHSICRWFDRTIYYFHVPLFFICSGYLFQRYKKIESLKEWKEHIKKKMLSLGVPYFTFSVVTWLLKVAFSDSVNGKVDGHLLHNLFLEPISPYWYLYCLFLLFLITPTFSNKKTAWLGVTIAMIGKMLSIGGDGTGIFAIDTVLANEIWFVFGMCLAMVKIQNFNKLKEMKFGSMILGVIFIWLSVIVHQHKIVFPGISFLMGMLACTAVVSYFYSLSERKKTNVIMDFLVKYTMPIFLMHTIFAAFVRIALMKLGVFNSMIHILLGIGISIVGPMIAAIIMKQIPILNFILYPLQYRKRKD